MPRSKGRKAVVVGALVAIGSAAAADRLRSTSSEKEPSPASRGWSGAGGPEGSKERSSAGAAATELARAGAMGADPTIAASARPHGRPPRPATGRVQAGPPKMVHLDPHHTDRSPYAGPVHPSLAWTFDTGGPIEAAPVMLDDGAIVVSSLSGRLFAIEPGGKLKFSVDLGERAYATPLVTEQGILAGSDARRFFRITPTGGIQWRLDTESDADTGAAPLLDRGFVFASGKVIYGAREDGTLLWRVRTRKKTYTSPAVADDGTVYAGSQDHRLYAITPDGHVRFRVDLDADIDGSPAIGDDGRVFVGTDGREIIAVSPDDGTPLWRTDVGGFVRGCLSIARDGTVLAGTYGPVPHLVALNPADGAVEWRFAIQGTGAPEFGIQGGPVEDAAGRLYFGAQDDEVYALDPDGKLLWKWKTGSDVDAPIVLLPDGTLLAGSDDGKLYAFKDP